MKTLHTLIFALSATRPGKGHGQLLGGFQRELFQSASDAEVWRNQDGSCSFYREGVRQVRTGVAGQALQHNQRMRLER